MPAGAAAASSAVRANGRMVACGHTKEQLVALDAGRTAFHAGTVTATPRFS